MLNFNGQLGTPAESLEMEMASIARISKINKSVVTKLGYKSRIRTNDLIEARDLASELKDVFDE